MAAINLTSRGDRTVQDISAQKNAGVKPGFSQLDVKTGSDPSCFPASNKPLRNN